jgi:hypothetical protein
VLLNIQDDREPIVGYVLGGLQESEITMLRRLLARLDQTLGPLRERLKILSMDRGYWGTDLFCELKQDYGIDFVSRVRDAKLDIHGSIQRQLEEPERRWTYPGTAPVLGTQGDAERASHSLASDRVNQRRSSRTSSNRGEHRGGGCNPARTALRS